MASYTSSYLCSQAGHRQELEDREERGAITLSSSSPVPPMHQSRTVPWCSAGAVLLSTLFTLALSPDEDLIRQILADGASGISHSQDLGPYMRAETDLISGL